MSDTIGQLHWGDVSNQGETNANSCCEAMGGTVSVVPGLNIEACVIPGVPPMAATSFPNTLSCSNLEALSEEAPSIAEESSGGTFGAWLSGNLGGISDLITGTLAALNPADVNTTIVNNPFQAPPVGVQDEEAERKKMITRIVVVAVLAVGAFFLYKKLKK